MAKSWLISLSICLGIALLNVACGDDDDKKKTTVKTPVVEVKSDNLSAAGSGAVAPESSEADDQGH